MILSILGWIAKSSLGKYVSIVADYLSKRQDTQAQITAAVLTAAVEETRIMSELSRDKQGHGVFWWFAGLFVLPLGIWWAAVCLDSTFLLGWGVADLPKEWIRASAMRMIEWLFYTGGTAAAIRAVIK